MNTKILLLIVLLFIGMVCFAQKNSFEAEIGANFSMENNIGNYGILGSTGINYYFADRVGVNTNIGFFQNFLPLNKYNNCSLFKWDADVFYDIIRTANDSRLRLSAGASYYRGAAGWADTLLDDIPVSYYIDFYHGTNFNGKIQYRFPLSAKCYMGINGECYYLPGFSTHDIMPALGCSLGYKF